MFKGALTASNPVWALLATLALATSASMALAAEFAGAGASFPASAYISWGIAYKAETGNSLDYQVAGSVEGQMRVLNRTADFGASDAPMSAEKLASGQLLQFPAVIGAVVVIVNLDGVKANELKLSGPLLAGIYLGRIGKWNDPAIAALNPDRNLPDMPIVPFHRSDPSGTTFVFTSYLSEVSATWKSQVGTATTVQWMAGASGKGNDGVADAVKNTKGAIGYVEYVFAAFAGNGGLTTARLQNRAGKFVSPSIFTFKAAAEAANWDGVPDFAAPMIDTDGENAWPIVSASFILLPKNPKDAARSHEVMKFFNWAFSNGDTLARRLGYVTPPQTVKDRIREAWRADIRDASGAAIWRDREDAQSAPAASPH